jgi:hypothetical protein
MRIGFPAHLLQILHQVFAILVHHEQMLTGVISELRVYAVHPVLHGWIRAGDSETHVVPIRVTAEEIPHDLPVGSGRGGAALLSGGIAIFADS